MTEKHNRNDALILSILVIFLTFFFVVLSQRRLIAPDEGFYLMASRLVMEGRIPYLDFFYPQMPVLPYLYGIWMKLFGISWQSGRALSGVFAALSGVIVYLQVRRFWQVRTAALAAVLIFCVSSMTFPWLTLAKGYASSTFFLLLAFCLADPAAPKRSPLTYVGCGLSFALAVGCRAYLVVCLPVLLWMLWLGGRLRFKELLYFFAGSALIGLPVGALLISDTDAFLFNNLGYHLTRSPHSLHRELASKNLIIQKLLGFESSDQLQSSQMALLLWISFAGAAYTFFRQRKIYSEVTMAILLIGISLLPDPSYVQYFCVVVPFLIICILRALQGLWTDLLSSNLQRRLGFAGSALLLMIFALPFPHDYERFTRTGDGVIGIDNPRNARDWNIPAVNEVAAQIETLINPGAVVLSFWPGYIFGTDAVALPYTENHFGWPAAQRLGVERSDRYKILSPGGMQRAIEAKEPQYIVMRGKKIGGITHARIESSGYLPAKSVNSVTIFVRSE